MLLGATLRLLVTLGVLSSVGLHIAELNLQLTDASLELGHGSATSTNGVLVGVSKLLLQLGQLGLECALSLALGVGVVLLSAELIRQTSSIHHSLLGLLKHVINLCVHSMDSALNGPLVTGSPGVDGGHLVDGRTALGELGLSLALASLRRVEEGASLLHLSGKSIGTAVGEGCLLNNLLSLPLLLLIGALGFPVLALVALDCLLGFRVCLVGMVKSNLKLVDVSLELLLNPQSF